MQRKGRIELNLFLFRVDSVSLRKLTKVKLYVKTFPFSFQARLTTGLLGWGLSWEKEIIGNRNGSKVNIQTKGKRNRVGKKRQ